MILGLRTYRVHRADREPLLNFMLDSLRLAGCRIIHHAEPNTAPFLITFETPSGERTGVVAYAFFAGRKETKNRPKDERSFQVKYGSKKDNKPHPLWIDPFGLFTTLFLGISPDAGQPYFVAPDPAMHNPTKFFIGIEFKDSHADEIRKKGWYAWERDSRIGDEPVEVLVGGTPEHFLDFVRFERATQGLDQGNRQLLAERPQYFRRTPSISSAAQAVQQVQALHPLATEFRLSPEELLDLIANAPGLKMGVRGWVAEEHLQDTVANTAGVTSCEKLDVEGAPDLRIRFRYGPPLTVECKNVLRKRDKSGNPPINLQRTRVSKTDPCSRYYTADDFDILASPLHAVTQKWQFRYVLPSTLSAYSTCPGKLSNNVAVGSDWIVDPAAAFQVAYSQGCG